MKIPKIPECNEVMKHYKRTPRELHSWAKDMMNIATRRAIKLAIKKDRE